MWDYNRKDLSNPALYFLTNLGFFFSIITRGLNTIVKNLTSPSILSSRWINIGAIDSAFPFSRWNWCSIMYWSRYVRTTSCTFLRAGKLIKGFTWTRVVSFILAGLSPYLRLGVSIMLSIYSTLITSANRLSARIDAPFSLPASIVR